MSKHLELVPNGNRQPVIVAQPKNDTWHCPPDLEGCPIAVNPKVQIPMGLFNRWIFLATQMDTEWIAYLRGLEVAPGEYVLARDGMYFPKQRVAGAHCDVEDLPGQLQPGTVAAVHSHVGMNVFFSAEDKKHFNHPIELVVNNRGEIAANGRTQLACKRYHRGPCDIIFTECEKELADQETLESQIIPPDPPKNQQELLGVDNPYELLGKDWV